MSYNVAHGKEHDKVGQKSGILITSGEGEKETRDRDPEPDRPRDHAFPEFKLRVEGLLPCGTTSALIIVIIPKSRRANAAGDITSGPVSGSV